jgi:hypothetical protein
MLGPKDGVSAVKRHFGFNIIKQMTIILYIKNKKNYKRKNYFKKRRAADYDPKKVRPPTQSAAYLSASIFDVHNFLVIY